MRGFDDYVNMVLDDVTEYELDGDGTKRKVQLDQVNMQDASRYRVQAPVGYLLLYVRVYPVYIVDLKKQRRRNECKVAESTTSLTKDHNVKKYTAYKIKYIAVDATVDTIRSKCFDRVICCHYPACGKYPTQIAVSCCGQSTR